MCTSHEDLNLRKHKILQLLFFHLHSLRFAGAILWKDEMGVLGFKQEAKRAKSEISSPPSLLWSLGCEILVSWPSQVLVRINFRNWEQRTVLCLNNMELQIRDFFPKFHLIIDMIIRNAIW